MKFASKCFFELVLVDRIIKNDKIMAIPPKCRVQAARPEFSKG